MTPEQPFVIGINGGGTHTDFLLADRHLQVLARVSGGPTNKSNIGYDAANRTLQQGIVEVCAQAGIAPSDIAAVGAGLSGLDRPTDHAHFGKLFNRLCPEKVIVLDNDAIPALVGGTSRYFGVVIISGTGAIAYGINAQRQRARSSGWGYRIDKGSGHAIGQESLNAIVSAYDQSGPPTALTQRVLIRLGLISPDELLDWMYAPDRRIEHIASLAAETITLAGEDLVATQIIKRAADALAMDAITVARRIGLVNEPFPLIMSGGIFGHSELLRTLFASTVQAFIPNAVPMTTDRDAAIGAAIMALDGLKIIVPAVELPTVASKQRSSEQRNQLTLNIHRRSTLDLVTLMNIEDQRVPHVIAPELSKIANLIDAIAERFNTGGRLIIAGAGTSGRLAVLDASECTPTFGTPSDRVIGLMAGGNEALFRSIENAEDGEISGQEAIAALNVGPADSVIGVAASGSTPFVVSVLREADARGALTGSIANVADAEISTLVQHPIVIITGPEVITGSTRLKAGTAQKMVLNMLSTGVMVRIGRTYSNLMVDMQTTNHKLRERAQVIVAEATNLSLEDAEVLLAQSQGEIKTAIAAALLGLTPNEARQRLATVGGNLNRVML